MRLCFFYDHSSEYSSELWGFCENPLRTPHWFFWTAGFACFKINRFLPSSLPAWISFLIFFFRHFQFCRVFDQHRSVIVRLDVKKNWTSPKQSGYLPSILITTRVGFKKKGNSFSSEIGLIHRGRHFSSLLDESVFLSTWRDRPFLVGLKPTWASAQTSGAASALLGVCDVTSCLSEEVSIWGFVTKHIVVVSALQNPLVFFRFCFSAHVEIMWRKNVASSSSICNFLQPNPEHLESFFFFFLISDGAFCCSEAEYFWCFTEKVKVWKWLFTRTSKGSHPSPLMIWKVNPEAPENPKRFNFHLIVVMRDAVWWRAAVLMWVEPSLTCLHLWKGWASGWGLMREDEDGRDSFCLFASFLLSHCYWSSAIFWFRLPQNRKKGSRNDLKLGFYLENGRLSLLQLRFVWTRPAKEIQNLALSPYQSVQHSCCNSRWKLQ